MKNLTKRQRHSVYKKAYKVFIKSHETLNVCSCCRKAIQASFGFSFSAKIICNYLPELLKELQKLEIVGKTSFDSYTCTTVLENIFPEKDMPSIRHKIFKSVIKDTIPKKEKEKTRIKNILKKWESQKIFGGTRIKLGSWKINKDLTVDVKGYVFLSQLDFEELPVTFNRVNGWFSLFNCENLKTLKGCPRYVGGSFDYSDCSNLESLKFVPKEVRCNFYATNCGKKFTEDDIKKYSNIGGNIYV